jgi:hypothetical protein
MGAGDAVGSVTQRYAELAEEARAEAERLRERWEQAGDDDGATLAGRLAGLLEHERDEARRGMLPPRSGGFPLGRFMGDYEWGPEGRRAEDLVRELQRCWQAGG